MKTAFKNNVIFISLTVLSFCACKKDNNPNIQVTSLNESLEIPYHKLQSDSIADQMVNGQIMVFENLYLDVNKDGTNDLLFEVVDLTLWNGTMPEFLDNMAARVQTLHGGIEIYDASTYGYADALISQPIDENAIWSNDNNFVLGTIADAGQFEGKKNRHLGFRVISNYSLAHSDSPSLTYNYGWVKMDCSAMSDTLTIVSHGINLKENQSINAGQIE